MKRSLFVTKHRMIEVGRDTLNSFFFRPLLKQGQLQHASKDCWSTVEYLQGFKFHNLSGPFPVLNPPHSKNALSHIQVYFPVTLFVLMFVSNRWSSLFKDKMYSENFQVIIIPSVFLQWWWIRLVLGHVYRMFNYTHWNSQS